jgi:hypothetical protein
VNGAQELQPIDPNPKPSNLQRLIWKGQELQSRVASASYTIEPPPSAPRPPSPSADLEPSRDPTEAHQSPDLPTASSPALPVASTSPQVSTARGQEETGPSQPPRVAPPSPPPTSQPPLAAEADKPSTRTPSVASPREKFSPSRGDPSNDDVAPSVALPPPLLHRPSQQQQQASRARGAIAPPPMPATGRGKKIIYNGKEVHSKVYQATVSSTVKQQTKAAVTSKAGGVAGRASPSPASAARVSAGNMFGRAQIGATFHLDNAAATPGGGTGKGQVEALLLAPGIGFAGTGTGIAAVAAQGLGGWATGGGKPGPSLKHLGTGTRFSGGASRGKKA